MLPQKMKTFIRLYMKRVYLDVINNQNNYKLSIINCRNQLSKELLQNVMIRMKYFKNLSDEYELQKKKLKEKKDDLKKEELEKEKKNLDYKIELMMDSQKEIFDVLMEYIFFEDNFAIPIRNKRKNL